MLLGGNNRTLRRPYIEQGALHPLLPDAGGIAMVNKSMAGLVTADVGYLEKVASRPVRHDDTAIEPDHHHGLGHTVNHGIEEDIGFGQLLLGPGALIVFLFEHGGVVPQIDHEANGAQYHGCGMGILLKKLLVDLVERIANPERGQTGRNPAFFQDGDQNRRIHVHHLQEFAGVSAGGYLVDPQGSTAGGH
ncbi:MAG: hypothetical protein ACD_75C02412G0003 [uncultured bacterium]|nr:MAG: hypothetical protein ACD_75C02412G0003 [uncultured bacterium]